MSKRLKLAFTWIIAAVLISSCNVDEEFIGNSRCYPTPPPYGQVKIDVTINQQNRAVPVEFFIGEYENNRTPIILDTLTTTEAYFTIPNGRVGIAVTYEHDGKTIVALDAVRMIADEEEDSDGECWDINCCWSPGYTARNMRLRIRD